MSRREEKYWDWLFKRTMKIPYNIVRFCYDFLTFWRVELYGGVWIGIIGLIFALSPKSDLMYRMIGLLFIGISYCLISHACFRSGLR